MRGGELCEANEDMNIFKAIFEGWIKPRLEYRAAEVVSTAESIAHAEKDESPAPPDAGEAPE